MEMFYSKIDDDGTLDLAYTSPNYGVDGQEDEALVRIFEAIMENPSGVYPIFFIINDDVWLGGYLYNKVNPRKADKAINKFLISNIDIRKIGEE